MLCLVLQCSVDSFCFLPGSLRFLYAAARTCRPRAAAAWTSCDSSPGHWVVRAVSLHLWAYISTHIAPVGTASLVTEEGCCVVTQQNIAKSTPSAEASSLLAASELRQLGDVIMQAGIPSRLLN